MSHSVSQPIHAGTLTAGDSTGPLESAAPVEDLPIAPTPTPTGSARAGLGRNVAANAGLLPFFLYVGIFLVLPTVLITIGAFTDSDGGFTLTNFSRLLEPNTVEAFGTSFLVSIVSSLIGSVVGALAAYVIVQGVPRNAFLRRLVVATSSVLAQFGGVMLAFAFIATVGINGMITILLREGAGVTLSPNWLSSMPGLITIYAYFQIPLMIIVFLPAVEGIRPQWREACESLGGSTATYWFRVGFPILWPRFAGAFLLLFANAFSAFATAAALFSQRSILVPLMIQGAMRNEQAPGQQGVAQVLAFSMVLVVALVMTMYAWLQRRTARWE